jgi:hypothetical protein
MSTRLDIVRGILRARLGETVKYQDLADELKSSKGAIWKFINTKYIPRDVNLRKRLLKLAPMPTRYPNYRKREYYLRKWIYRCGIRSENVQKA